MSSIELDGDVDQLLALRQMSAMGILHEAQIQNLKYWPRIVFPHSTHSEFTFDPDDKSVTFRLTVKGRAPRNMADRLKAFDGAVKKLLGEMYRVSVRAGGKVLMNSPGIPTRQLKAQEVKSKMAQTKFTGSIDGRK